MADAEFEKTAMAAADATTDKIGTRLDIAVLRSSRP